MPGLRKPRGAALIGALSFSMLVTAVEAHTAGVRAESSSGTINVIETLAPMVLALWLYGRGFLAIWKRAAHGQRELAARAIAFAGGMVMLGIALLSPLDRWGAELFAAHMVQHELLMLVAAPLLVLGRPLPVFLWAFRESGRQRLVAFAQRRSVRRAWSALLAPTVGWLLHALALWLWHIPAFFDAVLQRQWVHDLQHLTFLITALVFWAALLEERRRDHQGAGILYLFTTTVHTSVLGALITFASHPWYASYLQTPLQWGLTALEDQQLGGLIMWVPGSLIYIGLALVLLARWIQCEVTSLAPSAGPVRSAKAPQSATLPGLPPQARAPQRHRATEGADSSSAVPMMRTVPQHPLDPETRSS